MALHFLQAVLGALQMHNKWHNFVFSVLHEGRFCQSFWAKKPWWVLQSRVFHSLNVVSFT